MPTPQKPEKLTLKQIGAALTVAQLWGIICAVAGLLAGTFFLGGSTLHDPEIKALKTQIEVLKTQNDGLQHTQYDWADRQIDGLRKLMLKERESLLAQIEQAGSEKTKEVKRLMDQLAKVSQNIKTLDSSPSILTDVWFRQERIHDALDFYEANFEQEVSFHDAEFERDVTFESATFLGNVTFAKATFRVEATFDEVDLRNATFTKADFRGVDLSKVIYDEGTVFPKRSPTPK